MDSYYVCILAGGRQGSLYACVRGDLPGWVDASFRWHDRTPGLWLLEFKERCTSQTEDTARPLLSKLYSLPYQQDCCRCLLPLPAIGF